MRREDDIELVHTAEDGRIGRWRLGVGLGLPCGEVELLAVVIGGGRYTGGRISPAEEFFKEFGDLGPLEVDSRAERIVPCVVLQIRIGAGRKK